MKLADPLRSAAHRVPSPPVARSAALLVLLPLLMSAPASAQCPLVTDSDSHYQLVLPEGSIYDTALLVVMADGVGQVDIEIPICGYSPPPFPVSPGNPVVVEVCFNAMHDGDELATKGIFVAGVGGEIPNLHVVLKQRWPSDGADDAYLALPTSRLDDSYRPFCYPGHSLGGDVARFTVVANQGPLTLNYSNCDASPATPASIPVAGHTLQRRCASEDQDCSGFRVYSDDSQKFGLVSGTTCASVPRTVLNCESLVEMMPPEAWAGTEYFTTEFNKRQQPLPSGDVYRILPLEPVTITAIQAALGGSWAPDVSAGKPCSATVPWPTPRAAGDWCDINLGANTSLQHRGGRIQGTGKFLLGQ